MTGPLLSALGVEYVDHVAVTTPVFEQTVADFLALPRSRLVRGPGRNESQRVLYAFVQLDGGGVIEVLGPMPDTPISTHLQRGGGAYHICYAVTDLDAACRQAGVLGARQMSVPAPDPAFDGRRVVFLHHPAHGILELVESRPGAFAPVPPRLPEGAIPVPEDPQPGDADQRLRRAFLEVLPRLDPTEVQGAAFGTTAGWDSLAQLQLMGALEMEFQVTIPADDMASLTSFQAIQQYLRR